MKEPNAVNVTQLDMPESLARAFLMAPPGSERARDAWDRLVEGYSRSRVAVGRVSIGMAYQAIRRAFYEEHVRVHPARTLAEKHAIERLAETGEPNPPQEFSGMPTGDLVQRFADIADENLRDAERAMARPVGQGEREVDIAAALDFAERALRCAKLARDLKATSK